MDFAALVQQCTPVQVPVELMQKVAGVESTYRPFAIGYKLTRRTEKMVGSERRTVRQVDMLASQPKSEKEAIKWVYHLQSQGYEFDAGPMQIHSTNFETYGLTPETVFDTCTNIRVGAHILTDCYDRALPKYGNQRDALRATIYCYRWGKFSLTEDEEYVRKVVNFKLR